MEINIDNFLKETEAFLEEESAKANRKGSGEGNSKYKIVYPGVPGGKLAIKLLWNIKSGTVIRQIERHGGFGEKGNQKIPCLSKYGVPCPICDTIKEIEDQFGESSGIRNKHGKKLQSIAYAQLIDYNDAYKDMPEKGSIVLFMFPYTIYKQIMTQVNEAGQNSKILVSTNEGKCFNILTAPTQGPNMYTVNIDAFGTIKSFNTDEEYYKCLEELPDLTDTILPKEITEDLSNRVNAAVDTLKAEYGLVPSVAPVQATVEPQVQPAPQQYGTTIGAPVQQTVTTVAPQPQPVATVTMEQAQPQATLEQKIEEQANSNKPVCFGQYSMTEKKCLICPHCADCADMA